MSLCLSWASYQIHKIGVAHVPEMSETFSPPPRVSDPDMHHDTWVTHVPWWMPWSSTRSFLRLFPCLYAPFVRLYICIVDQTGIHCYSFLWSRWRGKNVLGAPGACTTRNFTYLVRGPCCIHISERWSHVCEWRVSNHTGFFSIQGRVHIWWRIRLSWAVLPTNKGR